MTAAHVPGAILTPRYRGARAVASFTAPVAQWIEQRSSSAPHAGSSPAGGASFNAGPGCGVVHNSSACKTGRRQFTPAHQTEQDIARRRFSSVIGCAASFNAADARSRATHLRAGWLPSVGVGHCNSQTGRHGPEMPARRSSDRPAAPFNAASNERSPEPGRCLVSSEAPGCRGDAYTQPSPCEMTTHCMAKANAGDGGRHGCTHHSDRKRRR